MRTIIFLAPIAVLWSSILQFANDNVAYAQPEHLTMLLAATSGGYCLLWLALRLFLGRDDARALCYWLAIFWLAYPVLLFLPLQAILGIRGITASAIAGAFLLLLLFLYRRKLPYSPLVASAILGIGLVSAATTFPALHAIYAEKPVIAAYQDVEAALAGKHPAISPHILYLVPDRYPSNSVARDLLGYDNALFTDKLESLGFHVWQNQYANYGKTFVSLASTLNMDYLSPAFGQLSGVASYLPMIRLMQDNQLLRILKTHHYRYVHMGDWWEPTRTSPYADVTLSSAWLNEFTGTYLLTTPLAPISPLLNTLQDTCARLDRQAGLALESVRREDPQFIFWHIFSVHPPYVFDSNGDCSSPVSPHDWQTESRTITTQIPPTNARLLRFITAVLEQSSRPVVIVLQADEGPLDQEELARVDQDFLRLSPERKRLKYGILNAIYLPSGDYGDFAAQQSPVNNFRLVLQDMFGEPLPMLPHRHHSFRYEHDPYDMRDISEELRPTE